MHSMTILSRRYLFVPWVAWAIACAEGGPPRALELGGGHAIVLRSSDATCPAGFDARHEAGDAIVCGDAAFTVAQVTRGECADHDLDCDALYGCVVQPLSACDSTSTTADCGGEGPTTLGCVAAPFTTGCRWFVGGCVADGFAASPCPAEDLCCEQGSWGQPTAYPDVDGASNYPGYAAGSFTSSYGAEPIALDAGFGMTVSEVEPPAATDIVITCPTPTADPFLCTSAGTLGSSGSDAGFTVFGSGLGTSGFVIDLRSIDGTTKARACHYLIPDSAVNACHDDATAGANCTAEGTVELGAERVRVTAIFGASTWVLEFPR